MPFIKELLLNKIASLGDFTTIQYISQTSFFIPLILVWILTIITFLLFAFIQDKQNLWIAFIAAIIVNLCGVVLIALGVLPLFLTFPNLYIP